MADLLVDTHALIWFSVASSQLSPRALRAIEDADQAYASIASVWEISIKVGLGKLDLGGSPEEFVRGLLATNIRILPIQLRHALRVEKLPRHHGDPFDRMLIAQAIEEDLSIVTADPAFSRYSVPIIW